MNMPELLDASSVEAIAALCERTMQQPPAPDELRGCLFAPDQPAVVRGDPAIGVVASVRSDEGCFIRLLAVHPDHQGRGHGKRLLSAAEADLSRGRDEPTTVTVGADAPYYLFPGVETSQTAMLCLLERARYERADANFNMDLDLGSLPPDPGGGRLAGAADREAVDTFVAASWPAWRAEVLRALDKQTLMIGEDDAGIDGFCAWDVNRRGLLGPVAVRLDLIGKGRGVSLLLGALHRIRAAGRSRIEISWVGPIVPYARVGATVGRVFFVYRKTIPASPGGPLDAANALRGESL